MNFSRMLLDIGAYKLDLRIGEPPSKGVIQAADAPFNEYPSTEDGRICIYKDISLSGELQKNMVEMAEIEKRRLGQDLHDGLCQKLKGIELSLAALSMEAPQGSSFKEMLSSIEKDVNDALCCAHNISKTLLPAGLDRNNFTAAIDALINRISGHGKARLSFVSKRRFKLASDMVAIHLYRIAEEAVRNAIAHGKAKDIRLEMRKAKNLSFRISDNGRGFDVSRNFDSDRLGLRIMEFRARSIGARLQVRSRLGKGTVICCSPIPELKSREIHG